VPTTKHDITVPKGANFRLNVQARDSSGNVMDLTGYQARFQVRETVDAVSPVMSGTTTDYITINAPGGVVMINVPASVTGAMTWTNGVWDLEIYVDPSNTDRIVEGFASLSPEVTR
jgi:hypothetical protein